LDIARTELGTPISVVHYERPRATELMPECEGRADRTASIACRRLHVDPSERRHPPHFSVRDRVHGAPASERQIGEPVAFLQGANQVKECFFVHRLHRARDVAMPIIERIVRYAAWS